MLNNYDMSGKLGLIKQMHISSMIFLFAEIVMLFWILLFYFLYPSPHTGYLAMCWLVFIGVIFPVNWIGALICCFLSMFLAPNHVIIITSAIMLIITLATVRLIWVFNQVNYFYLQKLMQLEVIKSMLLIPLFLLFFLINAGDYIYVVYLAFGVYEGGLFINLIVFYKMLRAFSGSEYREIYRADMPKGE